MRIVIASQSPYRVGVAEVPIVDGGFMVSMPQVLNYGLYVGVAFYVDRNDNDTCEPDESIWDFTTSAVMGNLSVDVAPDQWCYGGNGSSTECSMQTAQPACFVGTGQTDLTKPLPCNP